MTTTVTVAEGPAFVFVAVDHCTAECIGLHAAKRGTRFEALEPIRQGIRERFGGIGDGVARGLRLRHDHGSNYLADDFQQEVAFFGIESSPSFVREPERQRRRGALHPHAEENLLWVRSFATIEALRLALLAFKRTYNETVDAGEIRLSKPRPGATRPRRAGRGSVEANTVKPLSKNPGAVQPGCVPSLGGSAFRTWPCRGDRPPARGDRGGAGARVRDNDREAAYADRASVPSSRVAPVSLGHHHGPPVSPSVASVVIIGLGQQASRRTRA